MGLAWKELERRLPLDAGVDILGTTKFTDEARPGMGAESRRKKIDSGLKRIAPEMEAAFKAKDAARLASMYAPSAVLMPPSQEIVKGRAAIEAWFREPMSRLASVRIFPARSSVSGDAAYEVGTFKTIAEGAKEPGPITFKYVLLLRRVRAKWQVTCDIWNSDQSLPTAAR